MYKEKLFLLKYSQVQFCFLSLFFNVTATLILVGSHPVTPAACRNREQPILKINHPVSRNGLAVGTVELYICQQVGITLVQPEHKCSSATKTVHFYNTIVQFPVNRTFSQNHYKSSKS